MHRISTLQLDAANARKVVISPRKMRTRTTNYPPQLASQLSLLRIDSEPEARGMSWKHQMIAGLIGATLASGSFAHAGDIKITLPRRSHMTPVQRLNQDGVEAIRKHSYEKAETFFYKAYLLDPDDPFTLNNLGYISELKGQIDRAQNFYALAGKEASDAAIDKASSPRLEGRTLKEALAISDLPLQINHDNVEAVRLLAQGRGPEADLLLQQALKSDPNNIFTLNNMGVAKEMEGESQEALRYYDSAAAINSDAAAVVTLNRTWRGKRVSEMAAQNARDLRNRLETQITLETRLAELNTRGVSAINRNDLTTAEQDFRSAYALDPNNAFAANNIGYLSEIEGDRETAQFFYDKAQVLGGANTPVGLATRSSAEGLPLFRVASDSDAKVKAKELQARDARRQHQEPILLFRRDNSVVQEPATPPAGTPPPQ
jgi:Flp pilus assembly protein TadD